MRKFAIAGLAAGALSLAACISLSDVITEIQKDAKNICGVAVNAADLAVALKGQNVDELTKFADALAHAICDQYLAQVAPTALQADGLKVCVKVDVKGKPVEVCRP